MKGIVNYVYCTRCGKKVSNEVKEDIIISAWVECPECVKKNNYSIIDIIKSHREKNPYPEDIFREPYKYEKQQLKTVCKDNNIKLDRHFGSFGRLVWNNCLDDLEKELLGSDIDD